MKKIISHFPPMVPLVLLLTILLAQTACKKTDANTGIPSISQLRNYAPAPLDTIITVANPGQYIVIQGTNLAGTNAIFVDGFPATFNNALLTNENLILQIPAALALGSIDSGKANTLRLVSGSGEVTYKLNVIPPAPVISSVSNEMAHPGDTMNIIGYNYFFIKSITLPGNLALTNYTVNATGTIIHFIVPASLTAAGPIMMTTQSGTDTSGFNINDKVTGMLCNFDDINSFDAGSSSSVIGNDAVAYPNGFGKYAHMSFASAAAGSWGDGDAGRKTVLNAVQWVPVANLTDPTSAWAIKFEINVKNPWSAGCIFIQDTHWGRTRRFEPWLTSQGGIFITKGWQTITIPLNTIKSKANGEDGTGDPAVTVGDLIANNGNDRLGLLFDNPKVDVVNFDIAIDNIRIVKY